VIEFALLFGLGFLSASLLVMLLAPAIHRRIVRYTENRIKATMPISPQEVRAQRDMARAVYAAENARTKQELAEARDRSTALQLQVNAMLEDLQRSEATKVEMTMRIDELDVEAADARSRLREGDSYIQELKAALAKAEEAEAQAATEVDELREQLLRLTSDADNFRIDLSTRDTEMENLRLRINTLRDERESLRNELRQQTTRTKDAETRLAQEEDRVSRLDDKLNREIALRSDAEVALERRLQEIARLRERLGVKPDLQDPQAEDEEQQSPAATSSAPPLAPEKADAHPELSAALASSPEEAMTRLAEDASNRATALSERLINSKSTTNDDALRQEMAAISAGMIAVTAAREGKASPIHTILSGRAGHGDRESLAARAKKALASVGGDPA
jgi:chromosome segregation ATPase